MLLKFPHRLEKSLVNQTMYFSKTQLLHIYWQSVLGDVETHNFLFKNFDLYSPPF